MSDSTFTSSYPEVEIEILLHLQIGALLRFWGYPVRPLRRDLGPDGYPNSEKEWNYDLIESRGIQIGRKHIETTQQTYRRQVSWFKYETFTESQITEHIAPAGYINTATDSSDVEILCWNADDIPYLQEIADKLQKAFGRKVTIRLIRVRGVPSARSLTSLPISPTFLLTSGDLIDLFGQRISKRLTGIRLITPENGSDTYKLVDTEQVVMEIYLQSPSDDSNAVIFHCAILIPSLEEVARQELDGLVESAQSQGKTLTFTLENK